MPALTGFAITSKRGSISGVQRTTVHPSDSMGRMSLAPYTAGSTVVDHSTAASREIMYAVVAVRQVCSAGAKKQVVPTWTVLPQTLTCGSTIYVPPPNTSVGIGFYKLATNYTAGTLSGTVTAGGVPCAGYKVRLYYRPSGFFLEEARTSATGAYTFRAYVNTYEIGNYTVIATDITDTYDAVVHDRLTAG